MNRIRRGLANSNILYGNDGSLMPIPDPTKLTTDAVNRATVQFQRELANLREIFETRLNAIDEATRLHQKATDELPDMLERRLAQSSKVLDAKFQAINDNISSHVEWSSDLRPQMERLIAHLAALQEEKFESIDSKFSERNVWLHEKFDGLSKQFIERDVRTDQASVAARAALDAALKAASELVAQQNASNVAAAAKSETSFTKQIDQIGTIISTLEKALDARITELKERIDRGEGSLHGSDAMKNEHRLDIASMLQAAAVIAAFITVLVLIFHK